MDIHTDNSLTFYRHIQQFIKIDGEKATQYFSTVSNKEDFTPHHLPHVDSGIIKK